MDREAVHNEMERARLTFSDLVRQAAPADMRRRSNGTRWTNRQLLFHMLFGYLIVRIAHVSRVDAWPAEVLATPTPAIQEPD